MAPAAYHALNGDLLGQIRHWHRHVVLTRQFRRQGNVLVRQRQGKARRIELTPEYRPRDPFMQATHAACCPPADAFPERLSIDTSLHTECQAFGNRLANAMTDHVVDQLAYAPGANRPGIKHFIPKGIQNGLDALVNGALATDHHGEIARGSAALAPAYRRIQDVRTLLTKHGLDTANERWPAGRQVDIDAPRLDTLQHSASPRCHFLDLLGAGERGKDDIAQAGHFGWRTRGAGAIFDEWLHGTVANIEDDHRVIRLLDIPAHAHAHITKTNKSDCFHALSSSPIACSAC